MLTSGSVIGPSASFDHHGRDSASRFGRSSHVTPRMDRLGDFVVGETDVGWAVVGHCVCGDGVVGCAVIGFDVVGCDDVGVCVRGD